MPEYKLGDRVRFTAEQLGTIDPREARIQMTDVMVKQGDLGTVAVTPGSMPEGWMAVTPDGHEHLYVPVHPSMIEAAPDA